MSQGEKVVISVGEQLFEQPQVEALQKQIEEARSSGAKHIELNFEKCKATSAFGLNSIKKSHDELKAVGGGVTLVNLQPDLREILAASLFDTLVPVKG